MDPVLQVFKSPRAPIFDLSQRFRTVSIRDQMVRATLIAQRLPTWLQTNCAHHTPPRVLVAGAGACGLTVAVCLAQQGVAVEVVDVEEDPFRLQRKCKTRWVCPTQYDWPMETWRKSKYSWDRKHHAVFTWEAALSNELAEEWQKQLVLYKSKINDNILQFKRAKVDGSSAGVASDTGELLVYIEPAGNERPNPKNHGWGRYSAMVWAVGVGNERCGAGNYRGAEFWQDDKLEEPFTGRNSRANEGNVLVSGGGDGALQDLLRVLTRLPSAQAIHDHLHLEKYYDQARMLSVELRAERAIGWCMGNEYASPYLRELHDLYLLPIVEEILQTDCRQKIIDLCNRRPPHVYLITQQAFLTAVYPLNRFLGLLFIKALENQGVEWVHGKRVVDVALQPPNGAADYMATIRPFQNPEPSDEDVDILANVVVLRHGLELPEVQLPAEDLVPLTPRPIPPNYVLPPDRIRVLDRGTVS